MAQMSRNRQRATLTAILAAPLLVMAVLVLPAQRSLNVSDAPETPFKLATFDVEGETRVGMVMGDRILDPARANADLTERYSLGQVAIPDEMRALIESYDGVKARLYQIANYFADGAPGQAFAWDVSQVTIKAPIMYPWNLLAAAANYRLHAEEMGVQIEIDPDRDAPYLFAKSPRSSIIGHDEPYYMPPGRERIDWENELAVVIGRPMTRVPREQVPEYVFGYTIMFDVSDRGGRFRQKPMFGADWFSGKSGDRAAPMGPYITPKEFMPDTANLRMVTKVNGRVVQDGNTNDKIYTEQHLLSYASQIMTLWPGDVVATGTPHGVGTARKPPEFLKPGDVVTMEIQGIGELRTPILGPAGSE